MSSRKVLGTFDCIKRVDVHVIGDITLVLDKAFAPGCRRTGTMWDVSFRGISTHPMGGCVIRIAYRHTAVNNTSELSYGDDEANFKRWMEEALDRIFTARRPVFHIERPHERQSWTPGDPRKKVGP